MIYVNSAFYFVLFFLNAQSMLIF